ncbi:hypothetical protein J2Y63_006061 [Shinella sp. BE166]|jgi:hypothetical protein|uniref:hypothetical protein n=1 Tax=Shinella sp. BE166 TaxID=3373918 RepID=UPI003EBB1C4C
MVDDLGCPVARAAERHHSERSGRPGILSNVDGEAGGRAEAKIRLLEYWPFFVGCGAGALLFLSSMFNRKSVSLVSFVLLTVMGGGLAERFWRKD